MTDRETLKLALEALEDTLALCINYKSVEDADGYVFTEASDVIKQGESAHNALRQALDHVPDTTKMIEPDMGIDRGAWDDVPDATKWVDELRGGDETKEEPVAWVKDLTSAQPRCVTDLKYISVADTEAGVQYIPLYTAPPKREWVGLTDEEIDYIWGITKPDYEDLFDLPRAIEAKLKEKNT